MVASTGPARACRTGQPGPCVPQRTRFHCRCGCRPLQDRLGLSGTVSPAPACFHPTRPPPQLRLEHAEGAGPGRRTARTGPCGPAQHSCGPAQHSVTLKPQLAPSAGPARARQTGRTGPWGPPQHLVTLKPQLEASAGPARACQTGRPSPCVPQQDSVSLQVRLEACTGQSQACWTGQPTPGDPHRTRSHYRRGWRPLQDRLGLAGPVSPAPACPHRTRPPPQLRLEHAEGAGPGRRTARTGPCVPEQHSVTQQ